jgi:hypothetical protein
MPNTWLPLVIFYPLTSDRGRAVRTTHEHLPAAAAVARATPMPLTLEELQGIQTDAMADDVALEFETMSLWSKEEAIDYFESGGVVKPRAPQDVSDEIGWDDGALAISGVALPSRSRPAAAHLVPWASSAVGANAAVQTPLELSSQSSLGTLRWMSMNLHIGQDMLLLADPGARPRRLVHWLCALLGRELEGVAITRDTTESDLKQRREMRSGTVLHEPAPPLRAALYGRILLLEGVEKAERNVLPLCVTRSLTPSHPHALAPSHPSTLALSHPPTLPVPSRIAASTTSSRTARWRWTTAPSSQRHGPPTPTSPRPHHAPCPHHALTIPSPCRAHRRSAPDLPDAHADDARPSGAGTILRCSPDFVVVAIGWPQPAYVGNPLDPPLRSRFACRRLPPDAADDVLASIRTAHPRLPPDVARSLVAACEALRTRSATGERQAETPRGGRRRLPFMSESALLAAASSLAQLPRLAPHVALHRAFPYAEPPALGHYLTTSPGHYHTTSLGPLPYHQPWATTTPPALGHCVEPRS